jgi:NTP pyrophosphatase (non-canonical NTP hydrolase)
MKHYTDQLLKNFDTLMTEIFKENGRQFEKWGIQSHTLFEWLAYATEELGELSQAISEHVYRQGTAEDIFKEAIQLATLSLKIAGMIQKEV